MEKKKAEAVQVSEEVVQQEMGFTTVEEEIFPGGPARAEVEMWKSQFGELYSSEFGEEVFIWRVMTRAEYKQVLQIQKADAMYREERICEKCVIWPKGYNHLAMINGKAGIPTLLAEQIMDKSGFSVTAEVQKL